MKVERGEEKNKSIMCNQRMADMILHIIMKVATNNTYAVYNKYNLHILLL